MRVSFNGEIFAFEGVLETLPWYEWFVKGNGFELEVLSKQELNSQEIASGPQAPLIQYISSETDK